MKRIQKKANREVSAYQEMDKLNEQPLLKLWSMDDRHMKVVYQGNKYIKDSERPCHSSQNAYH